MDTSTEEGISYQSVAKDIDRLQNECADLRSQLREASEMMDNLIRQRDEARTANTELRQIALELRERVDKRNDLMKELAKELRKALKREKKTSWRNYLSAAERGANLAGEQARAEYYHWAFEREVRHQRDADIGTGR